MNNDESGGLAIPEEFQPFLERLRKVGYVKASWTIGEKIREGWESWDALLNALERSEVRDCDCELIFGKRDDGQGGTG